MQEIVLVSNLIFLILIIAFAIKVRADIENIKKKENNREKQNEIHREFETVKIHVAGLEDRIVSLEYDSKEIHEKIGQLTKDINDIKQSLKVIDSVAQSKNQNLVSEKLEEDTKTKYTDEKKISSGKIKDDENSNGQNTNTKYNIEKIIISLLKEGKSLEEISKILGLSYEEVKLTYMMFLKKSEQ